MIRAYLIIIILFLGSITQGCVPSKFISDSSEKEIKKTEMISTNRYHRKRKPKNERSKRDLESANIQVKRTDPAD